MNKREARAAVGKLAAWSLRRLARDTGRWETLPLPKDLTDSQKKKLAAAMLEVAEKLDPPVRTIEVSHAQG